jgi:hypothetical protein
MACIFCGSETDLTREADELAAAFLAEQRLLPAQSLAHRQKMKLVAQHRTQAHQLVTMPEQLPEIAFRRRGNPDSGKALREQKIENQSGIAFIRLLLTYFPCANLRGIPNPEFMTELRE